MRKRILAPHFLTMLRNPMQDVKPRLEVANQYPDLIFDLSKLEQFFEAIFSLHDHNLAGELSLVFMDRSSHCQLHGKYLQDFRPTDVITFPADLENELVGEICVSVDQAIEEAESRNLPLDQELSLYLIHGWLHLVGFDDLEKVDRKMMRLEEHRVINQINQLSLWPDFRLAHPKPR